MLPYLDFFLIFVVQRINNISACVVILLMGASTVQSEN